MTRPEHIYPSKINYFLWVPIVVLIFGTLVSAIIKGQIPAIIILSIAFGIVLLPIVLNTKYTINNDALIIKSGLIIKIDIDIKKIKKVIPNNTIWSAPALSSDRIEIFYNTYDSVVISPKNKKEFIEMLKQINPAIVSEV
ncbi:PH domain-containing protein [Mucilaginibacter polytrichastri]|uniref:PH domain-containing protein n=1 Tax=Mucilaginibacter polytrichastri TaxID=1302689 RepID=UPI0008ED7765|nr:PH domain-containing protein [Mucilaginibacter polytrichastri]SFS36737.1 PH domain-containing protein [Mucilaginibacter polytrichastri]